MECCQCAREFDKAENARAAISIFVMGDEYIYSYWYCVSCGFYTVEWYHDCFMGDDDVGFLAPVPRDVGDHCVQLIQACPDPFNKHCDCESHRQLYYGLPQK